MRFDDRLDTVLGADMATPFGAQSAWRQLTDLIGRRRAAPAMEAIERLRAIRGRVPTPIRAASARSLAFANPPAELVRLFAEDEPSVAAPVIAVARLTGEEWRGMLAGLPPTSRSLLRHRRDLPPDTVRALDSFGPSDFALPQPEGGWEAPVVAEAATPPESFRTPVGDRPATGNARRPDSAPANDANPPAPTGPFPIADLVARIDAYQRDHGTLGRPVQAMSGDAPIEHFCFETDATGTIRWVDGAPREPLIGVLLGTGSAQVDGVVSGAFRRRAPFADARLLVAGTSQAAGQWQVSATPAFDPASGRFTGYRGVARRPRADQRAEPVAGAPSPEALRALVHELRTPTNAISGFAEMIEAQVLGPAPDDYRERAAAIRQDTLGLLAAIDDVDTAARIEQDALVLRPGVVEVAPLMKRAAIDLEPLMRLRQSVVDVDHGPPGLAIAGDEVAVARLVSRLMALAVGASGIGERIAIKVSSKDGQARLAVERPRAFAAWPGEALLSLEGEDQEGSLLGTAFGLRLARNLAVELGGSLKIGEQRLTLRLPAALDHDVGQLSSN
ncbi:MAG: sensor histidine kinase [Sphingomonas sp.]|uniref:sensor histidine kinase n=1 Tax=Sphingomonas sp. TaxID=28214 RepID=UPI003F7FDAEC